MLPEVEGYYRLYPSRGWDSLLGSWETYEEFLALKEKALNQEADKSSPTPRMEEEL